MNNPINIIAVLFVIMIGCGYFAVMQSPDALEVFARKMRARARAMRASKRAWESAYAESIMEDETFDDDRGMILRLIQERREFDALVKPE